MATPLVLSFVPTAPAPFAAGNIVANLGEIARVLAIDPERGLLVRWPVR